MQTPVADNVTGHRSGGLWVHTGQLRVSCRMDDGTLATVTLPDDWNALVARVAALEAKTVPNSMEDLLYAG
jgi:hypothetical protein